jgi:cytochrome c biogenesis protein CcmG, thiol:disulfide interchange protein DsbE
VSAVRSKRGGWALWLPLAVFAAFVALVVIGLYRPADREVASGMVGKPLPEFALPPAVEGVPGLASADFKGGQLRLLNVFAPQLAALQEAGVEIDGVAIRDRSEDVAAFLERHGNPFARIGKDDVSAVQLALGSSGVPETFVIDGQGVIRYQHIGEIRPEQVPMILEKLKEAER